MAANLRDRLYWRNSPREPAWPAGMLAPIPEHGADADYTAMRDLYRTKLNHLRALRIQVRGTPTGVSMPQFSLDDFWERPDVLDAFILIEKWKLEKKREESKKYNFK